MRLSVIVPVYIEIAIIGVILRRARAQAIDTNTPRGERPVALMRYNLVLVPLQFFSHV